MELIFDLNSELGLSDDTLVGIQPVRRVFFPPNDVETLDLSDEGPSSPRSDPE